MVLLSLVAESEEARCFTVPMQGKGSQRGSGWYSQAKEVSEVATWGGVSLAGRREPAAVLDLRWRVAGRITAMLLEGLATAL